MQEAELDFYHAKVKSAPNIPIPIASGVDEPAHASLMEPCTPFIDLPIPDDDAPSLQKGCPPDAYSKMFATEPSDFDDDGETFDFPPKTLLFLEPADACPGKSSPLASPPSTTPPRRRVGRGIYSVESPSPPPSPSASPSGPMTLALALALAPVAVPVVVVPQVSPRTAQAERGSETTSAAVPTAVRVACPTDPLYLCAWPAHWSDVFLPTRSLTLIIRSPIQVAPVLARPRAPAPAYSAALRRCLLVLEPATLRGVSGSRQPARVR